MKMLYCYICIICIILTLIEWFKSFEKRHVWWNVHEGKIEAPNLLKNPKTLKGIKKQAGEESLCILKQSEFYISRINRKINI